MDRIGEVFAMCKEEKRAALIGFITAGDPSPSHTTKLAEALVRGGIDMLELGLPFSDPVADGATIQAASYRALRHGTRPVDVLRIAGEVASKLRVPVILLSYLNPIYQMGFEKFFSEAARLGISGVITADLPVDEADEYLAAARRWGIDTIFLISPTTPDERIKKIAETTTGFIYLVSLTGVTGVRDELKETAIWLLRRVKSIVPHVPAAIGFGVSKPEHVAALVRAGADGIIVGSALVKIIERNLDDITGACNELFTFVKQLREATSRTRP